MLTVANFKELEDEGFTVVPGVLPQADCDKYIQMYNQWLEQFPRDKWPKSNKKGMIRGYNSGHLEPTWQIRFQVKHVISQIWKTEKLMTNIDSIAIGRPPEDGEELFDEDTSNCLHIDQESFRQGLHAYQGCVYLEKACADDCNLQVMSKSHQVFEKFFNDFPKAAEKSDENPFFILNKTQIKYFEQNGCTIKRVAVPKGGMLLWDSRLVHGNAQPKENRKNPGRWRYVVFVSMTPARWASEEDLAIKREAYAHMEMTTHWSSEGSQLMKETLESRSYGRRRPNICIERSEKCKLLAGAIPYDFYDGKDNGPPKPTLRKGRKRKSIDED